MLLNFFSLQQRSLFSIHDPVSVKLFTRLWLKFSHLHWHKFVTISKTAWVLCVIVVLKQEQPITFCVGNFLQIKDKTSWWCLKNLNEESLIDVYYMAQIGIMRVNLNKWFSIHSVVINRPNVSKDLLLTSANFVQLLPLCFPLYVY